MYVNKVMSVPVKNLWRKIRLGHSDTPVPSALHLDRGRRGHTDPQSVLLSKLTREMSS